MTVSEANSIVRSFFRKGKPTESDVFLFTEALGFLIEETKDPSYMMELGGYYYEIRNFDLALKYYDLAASYDYEPAFGCLGYIWYYGRTGQVDYKKAFENFKRSMEQGNLESAYKVADMYKNGYYVEKDYEKYKQMIEDLYHKVKRAEYVHEPLPEVFTRLARIRKEEGKPEEAANLYLKAKSFLACRIKYNAFFGNLSIMKWLIDDLYTIIEWNPYAVDLYDLFWLMKEPGHLVTFRYGGKLQTVETVEEDGAVVIRFNDSWFRTREDFFRKAYINGEPVTKLADEFYRFEVQT